MGRHLVTAHQANYLPYLGFFEKILRADVYILVDDTQFVKRGSFGWIHRNRILGVDGPLWLSLPIVTHGRFEQNISEAEIQDQHWRKKHLKSLEFAYRKTPFFDEIFPQFEELYAREYALLVDISQAAIELVLKILKIVRPISRSSELKISGSASDYVLELAQKAGATHYLSGCHGKDYLEQEKFKEANMGLVFQDFVCLPYPQIKHAEFVSHLSAVDALFQAGPEKTLTLLKEGARYEVPPKD